MKMGVRIIRKFNFLKNGGVRIIRDRKMGVFRKRGCSKLLDSVRINRSFTVFEQICELLHQRHINQ